MKNIDLSESRVLVTGAAGFIGNRVSRELADLGAEVAGVDSLNDYYDVSLKKDRLKLLDGSQNFTFHRTDVSDREGIGNIFSDFQPEVVIHLAAQAGVRYSTVNPFAYELSNGLGFLTLIEAARHAEVKNFVYASSSSVYGNSPNVPYSESVPPDEPVSFYAATKRYNEHTAAVYSHQYGLNCTGLRFFTVYGPWGRPDMAYFSFTNNIMAGKPITVYEKGVLRRDYTYIADIVSGVLAAASLPSENEVFNLGNHRNYSILEMLSILEELLGRKAEIKWEPRQPGDVNITYADIEKAGKLLGYRPETNLEEGLKKFADWYKDYYL